MSTKSVAVYNLGGVELLGHVSLHHAITNVVSGKYKIREAIAGKSFGEFEWPKSVETVRYIFAKWKYERSGVVPFSKRGVLRRDNFICCYCNKPGADSVDHVQPKWRGNAATWNNAVASHTKCNMKKGGRSPKEAGMTMHFLPYTPNFEQAYSFTRNRRE